MEGYCTCEEQMLEDQDAWETMIGGLLDTAAGPSANITPSAGYAARPRPRSLSSQIKWLMHIRTPAYYIVYHLPHIHHIHGINKSGLCKVLQALVYTTRRVPRLPTTKKSLLNLS